jgi:hypothetical protein
MQIFNATRILSALALYCAIASAPLHAQQARNSNEQLLDQIVVIVNEDVVLLSELNRTLEQAKKKHPGPEDPVASGKGPDQTGA